MFNSKKRFAGFNHHSEPRPLGELYAELLNSNSPLADAMRKRMAEKAGYDQPDDEDYHPRFVPCPNTELCVDLKLLTRDPGRLPMGKMLSGVITRDDYEHYTFLENASKKKTVLRRNPHIYIGDFINVNRRDDGTIYPTFCRPRYDQDLDFAEFCRRAADELYIVAGLVEKRSVDM